MYLQILILVSGASFVYYGLSSYFSKKMKVEYARWGYTEQRFLIGSLQLLGGLGLFMGFFFKALVPISSASLMLLMLAAIGVRIKINDKLILMFPAIFYALINFLILIESTF